MSKKIFITGGLGYIGSVFAKEAVKKGYSVKLYDSLVYEQNYGKIMDDILSGKSNGGSVKLVIGDTRNIGLLEENVKKFRPDYIMHLGELSSVNTCGKNPPHTEDVNYNASKKVIDLCEKLEIPVIYNSTSSLYGNQKEMRLMTENDPLPEPTDYYCRYKIKMEEYIKQKVNWNKKFKIIVFRPATICGLSPRMRIELLPNHFTYCAVSKGVLKISQPNSFRAIMDIKDLVNGYFAVIEKGVWKKLIYNIGHHNLSKIQVASAIQEVAKCEVVPMSHSEDLRNLQIDCSLFNEEFDFKPSISHEQSIRELAGWVRENLTEMEKTNFAGILNMTTEQWQRML